MLNNNQYLKILETTILQSTIDYQLWYDDKWWQCDITTFDLQNKGDYLQLSIAGKDHWGNWIFEGQIKYHDGIILQAKKTYQKFSINDYSIFYEGSYDEQKNGIFGRWYYNDFDDPNIKRDFFLKFIKED